MGFASLQRDHFGIPKASLFGNIDIGLSTRGLLGQEIGGGGPNYWTGLFIGDADPLQMGLTFGGGVTISGSVDLLGFLSVASINVSTGRKARPAYALMMCTTCPTACLEESPITTAHRLETAKCISMN